MTIPPQLGGAVTIYPPVRGGGGDRDAGNSQPCRAKVQECESILRVREAGAPKRHKIQSICTVGSAEFEIGTYGRELARLMLPFTVAAAHAASVSKSV